jgi:hypothetical protein
MGLAKGYTIDFTFFLGELGQLFPNMLKWVLQPVSEEQGRVLGCKGCSLFQLMP